MTFRHNQAKIIHNQLWGVSTVAALAMNFVQCDTTQPTPNRITTSPANVAHGENNQPSDGQEGRQHPIGGAERKLHPKRIDMLEEFAWPTARFQVARRPCGVVFGELGQADSRSANWRLRFLAIVLTLAIPMYAP